MLQPETEFRAAEIERLSVVSSLRPDEFTTCRVSLVVEKSTVRCEKERGRDSRSADDVIRNDNETALIASDLDNEIGSSTGNSAKTTDTSEENESVVNAKDKGGASTKPVRVLYRINDIYADFLKKWVLHNPNCKRMGARSVMIEALVFSRRALPEGFPTESQVRRRVTGLKKYHKIIRL